MFRPFIMFIWGSVYALLSIHYLTIKVAPQCASLAGVMWGIGAVAAFAFGIKMMLASSPVPEPDQSAVLERIDQIREEYGLPPESKP